jgi:hypothetical protein
MGLQCAESFTLVAAHDRGVSHDVAEHDRGKLARRIAGSRIGRRGQRASPSISHQTYNNRPNATPAARKGRPRHCVLYE